MTSLEFVHAEIERMRFQIRRQHNELLAMKRWGVSTESAETLLERMRSSMDGLCKKRDWLLQEKPIHAPVIRRQAPTALQ